MMKNILKNNKGFTLIEIIVVIIILGILAGIATPKVLETVKGSRMNTAVTNLQMVNRIIGMYYAENNNTLPTTAQLEARLSKSLSTMGMTLAFTQGAVGVESTYNATFDCATLGLSATAATDNVLLAAKLAAAGFPAGTAAITTDTATAGKATISNIVVR